MTGKRSKLTVTDPQAERYIKKLKKNQTFWEVKTFLTGLKLKWKERNKGTKAYFIEVPLFGMRFRFNEAILDPSDEGWDVINIDPKKLTEASNYFEEAVFWTLIEKGYFAYIREYERGISGSTFQALLVTREWAKKIMFKRIEMCGKNPRHTFMKVRMEEYLKIPVSKVLSFSPSFFDYLF